jgi:hypothetical protein
VFFFRDTKDEEVEEDEASIPPPPIPLLLHQLPLTIAATKQALDPSTALANPSAKGAPHDDNDDDSATATSLLCHHRHHHHHHCMCFVPSFVYIYLNINIFSNFLNCFLFLGFVCF